MLGESRSSTLVKVAGWCIHCDRKEWDWLFLSPEVRSVVIKDSEFLGSWDKCYEGKELERTDSTWWCVWELTDSFPQLHRVEAMIALHLGGEICLGPCLSRRDCQELPESFLKGINVQKAEEELSKLMFTMTMPKTFSQGQCCLVRVREWERLSPF